MINTVSNEMTGIVASLLIDKGEGRHKLGEESM